MNAANSAPLFPSPSPPLLHLNLPPPQFQAAAGGGGGGVSPTPAVGPRHVVGGGDVADRIKQSPPPLDLTNKSPEPPTAGGNDDMAATAAAKLGLENHLNLLKMKEMEMMKTVPVNRCVFSAKQPLQFFLSVRML